MTMKRFTALAMTALLAAAVASPAVADEVAPGETVQEATTTEPTPEPEASEGVEPQAEVAPAPRGPAPDRTCDQVVTPGLDGWSEKLGGTEANTLPYTAPDGFLVAEYCVKAGSANQGEGPVFVLVEPNAAFVVIDHPTVNSISHFMVRLVPEPVLPVPVGVTPAAQVTQALCEAGTPGQQTIRGGAIVLEPQDGVRYEVTDADGAVVTQLGDLAPGTYTVTARIVERGYQFVGLSEDWVVGEDVAALTVVIEQPEDCAAQVVGVTPSVQVAPAVCVAGLPGEQSITGGLITVTPVDGLRYEVTRANGTAVASLTNLAPGSYRVTASTTGEGFELVGLTEGWALVDGVAVLDVVIAQPADCALPLLPAPPVDPPTVVVPPAAPPVVPVVAPVASQAVTAAPQLASTGAEGVLGAGLVAAALALMGALGLVASRRIARG
jgi:hypothetical protein